MSFITSQTLKNIVAPMEHYLLQGALFEHTTVEPISVDKFEAEEPGVQLFEMQGRNDKVRIFNYIVSSLADDIGFKVYEVPKRDVTDLFDEGESEDYEVVQRNRPNRVNLEERPIDVYEIKEESDADYENKARLIVTEGAADDFPVRTLTVTSGSGDFGEEEERDLKVTLTHDGDETEVLVTVPENEADTDTIAALIGPAIDEEEEYEAEVDDSVVTITREDGELFEVAFDAQDTDVEATTATPDLDVVITLTHDDTEHTFTIEVSPEDTAASIATDITAAIDGDENWNATRDDEEVRITQDDDEPFTTEIDIDGRTEVEIDEYTVQELTELGDLIFNRRFFLEAGAIGSPPAGELGAALAASTTLILDTANHNYVLKLENYDDDGTGRDFFLSVVSGAPHVLRED